MSAGARLCQSQEMFQLQIMAQLRLLFFRQNAVGLFSLNQVGNTSIYFSDGQKAATLSGVRVALNFSFHHNQTY